MNEHTARALCIATEAVALIPQGGRDGCSLWRLQCPQHCPRGPSRPRGPRLSGSTHPGRVLCAVHAAEGLRVGQRVGQRLGEGCTQPAGPGAAPAVGAPAEPQAVVAPERVRAVCVEAEMVRLAVGRGDVPVPLGWVLSESARRELKRQLGSPHSCSGSRDASNGCSLTRILQRLARGDEPR